MTVAVIADIVASRALPDRAGAQQQIEAVFARVHDEEPRARTPFYPTAGDEFQAVYEELSDALAAIALVQLSLPPELALRFGLGIGEVAPLPSVDERIADGPGWWAAREAIEEVEANARRNGGRSWIVVADGAPTQDAAQAALANAYLLLRDRAIAEMSDRERRLIAGRLQGRTQQQLAAEEGITQPAVSQALASAGATVLLTGIALLRGGRAG